MPEPNENPTTPILPKEICTMRIIFPVVSDAQALDVKSKVSAVLVDIPDAQIHFALMPVPIAQPNYRGPQIP